MSLSYAATVPRHLVHRRSPADVLLTDYETVDGTHRAAVQLPTSHRMFAPVRRTHDSLMVAEALRQAISLFCHVNHGVPLDHVVFIEHSRFEILDPLSVDEIDDSLVAESITTDVTFDDVSMDNMKLSAKLLNGNRLVAFGTASVRSLGPEVYSQFRTSSMADPHFRYLPAGTEVVEAPAVGRLDPSDVVLARHTSDGTIVVAPDPRNLAMFDHSVEYLPGVTMLEAARQALRLATGTPMLDFTSCEVRFMGFAEWANPCSVIVDTDPTDGVHRIQFEHDGSVLSAISVTATSEPWLVPSERSSR
ncbi:AfsA-related hotdog domain-containing protein [Rhodococcus ruber]|uniref:AfsA-related hotdog domain-containing protein n=1 Tax=Rhodococcus ruber TaxID=1830 RepID=A0ABT4MFC2_9NOCA|nr:AfsA-related hotdog domain-containing protein [Rhodococcus ruber]MCZ4519115.1 AfsA-related hotdog domain-containing protein [Rhodococcus ruber]